ncbi:S41 family peptidase [Oceanibaculum indicum]|uniref:C-terminal processing peptidase S41A n=1 Tax=Oceanibaculum indicum P24 TaxID=1207063 RepID=K2JCV7_9PROT|nr:S41 family peptidase [Oceanibaculum indicum]EKE68449.1 C-terminal processing peptidase S41A [Oceanibaculum indicum P24]
MKYLSRIALATSVVAIGLYAAGTIAPMAQTGQRSETYRQLNLFGEVFERVRADYVEEVTDEKLVESAINGMLTALDPHSGYLTAKSYQDMQVQTRGEFGGLGIEVTMEQGLVKVVSPIDETPAFRAGLQPGDFITHLDGEQVLGLTLAEAVERMRGRVGSEIKLTIRRAAQEPFEVTIKRDVIRIRSVRSRAIDNIGYIRITTFNEQTQSGLEKAIADLRAEKGKDLIGIVLDLRNNPGGLLDQAISVSDSFLNQGEIVSTRGRRTEDSQRFNAKSGDIADGLPIVALINDGSASASEIVAGALQDHKRALVLGTKSFGKGSVQTIIPLPGHGAMRLTTARYYTPSGRSIQAVGIEPDLQVPAARIDLIDESKRRSEADLRGALNNDTVKPQQAPANQNDPAAAPAPEAAPAPTLGDDNDYQLIRAVDLLRGLHMFNKRAVN